MAIKLTLVLAVASAASLAKAQFGAPHRDCTFAAYTSSDCTGDAVAPSVPHYASCWIGALQSYSLEGPECYKITVEGYADNDCAFPYANSFTEAHPIGRAGCYKFTTNPQSAYWFFQN